MSEMFGLDELEATLNLILLKGGGMRSRSPKTTRVTGKTKASKSSSANSADPTFAPDPLLWV